MSELVKLDYKEFGIEETKAKEIASQFQPMLDKMVELETEANEVFSLDINDKEASKKAKEVRLKYVKVRTGTAEIHKNQKAFYLSAGRYVDGFKNVQSFASQGIEDKLEAIEKHAENLEKERISKLQESRLVLVSEYTDDVVIMDLGNMEDEVFEGFLNLKKTQKSEREEAVRLAEEKRIEEEKAETERLRLKAIEDEKIRKENEKLKADAESKELLIKDRNDKLRPYIKYIRDYDKVLNLEQKDFDLELKNLNTEAIETIKLEEEQRLEREKESEKTEKLEAELKAKQLAEAQEIGRKNAEILAKQKEADKLAKAPVKNQLNAWVDSFEISQTRIENETSILINEKFNAFKSWAKSEIEKL
jgi:hypothetical protein